jgi:hypothetical protein
MTIPDPELERLAHRRLSRLAPIAAPATLLPRVMASVRALAAASRRAPSGWFEWPIAWRLVSITAIVLAVAAVVVWWPAIVSAPPRIFLALTQAPDGRVAGIARVVKAGFVTAAAVWTVVQPLAVYALVLIAVMTAASACFAAALRSVLGQGVSR